MKPPNRHRPGKSPTGRTPAKGSGAKRPAAGPAKPPRPEGGRDSRRPPVAPAPAELRPARPRLQAPVATARGDDAPPPRRATPETPKGAVWLYGFHAVAAALANPARRLRRLLVTNSAEATLGQMVRPPWPVQPESADRARLDRLLGASIVHQGVALLTDALATPTLQQALERPGPVIVLDHVADPRNIGAILRTAAAFGAAAVVMQDRNAPEETGALAKAASGALEAVPILRAVNIARTMVALRAAGLWVVGLAAEGGPLSGPALARRRVALVLGSEGEGMRRLTRETCDELAGIAMPGAAGRLDSLNVSAAAAIALYELSRTAQGA